MPRTRRPEVFPFSSPRSGDTSTGPIGTRRDGGRLKGDGDRLGLRTPHRVASAPMESRTAAGVVDTTITRQAWSALAVTTLVTFLVVIDISAVNVAFPSIEDDFDTTRGTLSWIISGYNIMVGALLLAAGRLADSVGRRKVFVPGVALFMVGSLLCGLAGSVGLLIAARLGPGGGWRRRGRLVVRGHAAGVPTGPPEHRHRHRRRHRRARSRRRSGTRVGAHRGVRLAGDLPDQRPPVDPRARPGPSIPAGVEGSERHRSNRRAGGRHRHPVGGDGHVRDRAERAMGPRRPADLGAGRAGSGPVARLDPALARPPRAAAGSRALRLPIVRQHERRGRLLRVRLHLGCARQLDRVAGPVATGSRRGGRSVRARPPSGVGDQSPHRVGGRPDRSPLGTRGRVCAVCDRLPVARLR